VLNSLLSISCRPCCSWPGWARFIAIFACRWLKNCRAASPLTHEAWAHPAKDRCFCRPWLFLPFGRACVRWVLGRVGPWRGKSLSSQGPELISGVCAAFFSSEPGPRGSPPPRPRALPIHRKRPIHPTFDTPAPAPQRDTANERTSIFRKASFYLPKPYSPDELEELAREHSGTANHAYEVVTRLRETARVCLLRFSRGTLAG